MNFSENRGAILYSPATVLKVSGEDAQSFLQGQFTQNVKLPVGGLAYGLLLNQKGKVLADGFVLCDGADFWIASVSTSASVVRERLEAYVIADDVTLEDVTRDWTGVAFFGTAPEALRERLPLSLPAIGAFSKLWDGFFFRGRREDQESWEWILPVEKRAELDDALSELPRLDSTQVERLRIEAGIPAIPRDLGEKDLPNEGGLEEVAISYSKGCYLGQEVMARLKAMGQVRRRLVRVHGNGSSPAILPLELFVGEKKVGELRSAVGNRTGDGFVGLAMLSLLNLDPSAVLRLAEEEIPRVRITVPAPKS